ncbi:TIGR02281 family clan AA aspartic protease [Salinicola endophyticus]|uniref:TIGR02281 family clan AA aspartic protease n=1 Tax=Salinicola endophyticus TaxID=1949083 RepID=A0ABY8FNA4_9GAMM|nr:MULTISPECIES: retropepsin-like aspartic protease [Salinicola]WFF42206.1 TIGR02281 family clan AA aspartic protease [Salinicola endophyticus]
MADTQRTTRRLGLGMMLLCWVVMLALAVWWFRGVESRRANPNLELSRHAAPGAPVTLARNAAGHFVAPGEIDGQPVTFLLDTGATYVSLSRGLAERLGLQPGPAATFTTANGRVEGRLTTLDSVRLGGLSARRVAGSIHAGIGDDMVLLGMSFLGRFDIQIRADHLTLSPRKP